MKSFIKIAHKTSILTYAAGKSVVYVAMNDVNKKIYVGVTKQNLNKRMISHFADAKTGRRSGAFQRAICKYGRGAFSFYIFSTHNTYDEAKQNEVSAISDLAPEYNMTAGGEGTVGWVPSDETKKKISVSRKGQPGPWKDGVPIELRLR